MGNMRVKNVTTLTATTGNRFGPAKQEVVFSLEAANNLEKVENSSTRYLATLANEKNPQVKGYLVAKLNSKPLIVP